jgi:hypothetical protein
MLRLGRLLEPELAFLQGLGDRNKALGIPSSRNRCSARQCQITAPPGQIDRAVVNDSLFWSVSNSTGYIDKPVRPSQSHMRH